MSIATTASPAMVNAKTTCGAPPRDQTSAATPSTSASRAACARRRTCRQPREHPRRRRAHPSSSRRRRRGAPRRDRATRAARRTRLHARRRGTRRRSGAGARAIDDVAGLDAPDASTGAAGELAGRLRASDPRSVRSRRTDTANMSWSTKATRSAGARVSSTTSSARPTESASTASCAGSPRVGHRLTSVGHVRVERVLARAVLDRSMSRHTRATTVVSHPPRLPMSLVSERLRRNHVSCTASSASVRDPSIR